MTPFVQNSIKYKLVYSDRKQISGCLGTEEDGKGQDGSVTNTKGQRKLWGMMDLFFILTW